MKFKKLYITGIGGVGKTFLGKKISRRVKIKFYELDDIVLKKDVFERVNERLRDKKLANLINRERWIIDGAYSGDWIGQIIRKCDLIIILNKKYSEARNKIFLRYFKGKFLGNRRRENLKEVIRLAKLSNKRTYNNIIKTIRKFSRKYNKKIIVLKNNEEIKKFLKQLKL